MAESVTLLDGQVIADQPASGFRSGLDAVLLGASIKLKPDEFAIEMGCAAGAAMLVAAHHNPAARFTGIDADEALIDLAEANIVANGWGGRMRAVCRDIAAPDDPEPADQVFFNPPFYDDETALKAPAEGKRAAFLSSGTPLPDWIGQAHKRLKSKGRLTLIHRADRLADILSAMGSRFGDLAIKPVAPYAGKPAKRVLVSGRKGTKGPFTLLPPLVLHDGPDRKYAPEAEAILRGRARVVMG
ncbi:tRNA1(Val) (adenine(37)-N6)-methyltransferase [Hyphobacterium sp.]|uniref:tRNA1(Val) (adenine(37)-N6)-methyltransferase n=1 Tax=Hyphobacterium sp. TaxID=2004662 RepID=UPI003BAD47EF